jgi:hypothetical protein
MASAAATVVEEKIEFQLNLCEQKIFVRRHNS